MKAYRRSVSLKLGLIVFAVLIAVASLAYTHRLVGQLREREQAIIRLWAGAQAQVAQTSTRNPYRAELDSLQALLAALQAGHTPPQFTGEELAAYLQAVRWAEGMPPSGELNFITNEIIIAPPFADIPAIVTDSSTQAPLSWRNVPVPPSLAGLSVEDSLEALRRLRALREEMDETYAPILIELGGAEVGRRLAQYVHYGESDLIEELRLFPYVQLLFVGLFILVGYLGFSYVRRSEQSNLWVGMAREAAHQLGTPISSLMGWAQLLRSGELAPRQQREALDEVERDIERLRRVTARFSDIGSLPKLETQPLAPVVESTVRYIRRRLPQASRRVMLTAQVPAGLRAPLNADLFEWVVENLLKNALDAIEAPEGAITITARRAGRYIHVDVRDTGRGIERRQWKNVFRPGYSTKRRGWGLGLSLARRIVEDYHGGALTLARSKPGEGTTFRIKLPAS